MSFLLNKVEPLLNSHSSYSQKIACMIFTILLGGHFFQQLKILKKLTLQRRINCPVKMLFTVVGKELSIMTAYIQ